MSYLTRLKALAPAEQGLVCLAVLLDGHDAADILACDADRGPALSRVAKELVTLHPELRIPLLGTMLRAAAAGLSADS